MTGNREVLVEGIQRGRRGHNSAVRHHGAATLHFPTTYCSRFGVAPQILAEQ